MSSDVIDSLGLFTAVLKPLHAYNYDPLASVNTAGAVNHTFSYYYAQYSARWSSLVRPMNWT